MGLSFAISAGIVMLLIIYVMLSIPGFVDEILSISDTAQKSLNLDKQITDTSIDILSTSMQQNSYFVTFQLENDGTQKLWQYDKFNLLVTYDANITDTKTKITEKLTFSEIAIEQDVITFDNVSSTNATCFICTFTHEVSNAGTAKILLVGVGADGVNVTAVAYNSKPLTQIRFDDGGGPSDRSDLWYIINPDIGSNSVQVFLAGSTEVVVGALSLNGVSQTDPIDTHNGTTGDSDTPTVDITTGVEGALIVNNVVTREGPLTPGAGQQERWDDYIDPIRGAGSTNATNLPGPYTMSWTNEFGDENWSISAVSLNPGIAQTLLWSVNSITNDLQEPSILNPGETATIVGKLSYPLAEGGTATVIVSTDNGVSATESVIGS